jgi:hypothetical protein
MNSRWVSFPLIPASYTEPWQLHQSFNVKNYGYPQISYQGWTRFRGLTAYQKLKLSVGGLSRQLAIGEAAAL